MILLLDNYDSFVYNLARYVRELGGEPVVRRSDTIDIPTIRTLAPSHIIISPGPCTPREAGVSNEAVRRFGPLIPTLGVCLGHQCIGAAFGGNIVRAKRAMHGKVSLIEHTGQDVFHDLPNPLSATRYHSLAIEEATLPAELTVTARTHDGEIMGVAHRVYPVSGVQFHPESILTDCGHDLLRNFLTRPAGR